MELIQSQKGKDKLSYNGYIYRQKTKTKTTQCWICSEKICMGSASTPLNYHVERKVRELRPHNHPPDPAKVQMAAAVDYLMTKASTSDAPPHHLISNTVLHLSPEALAMVPNRQTLRTRIQRKRRRQTDDNLPEPKTIKDFVLHPHYRVAKEGEREVRFLLSDSQQDENEEDRMLVFATDAMLHLLQGAEAWMCDGAFNVVPHIHFQLYTVHAVINDSVFPCVYALIPDKTRHTYRRLFQLVKDRIPLSDPRTVVLGFEQAAVAQLRETFPAADLHGCFFHLTRSVWRQVLSLGLSTLYLENEEFCRSVKQLCGLCFVNRESVVEAFDDLRADIEKAFANVEQEIDGVNVVVRIRSLFDYFEVNYIGKHNRRKGWKAPYFPIHFWNVRTQTVEGIPHTANCLEDWQRRIQLQFESHRSSLWRLINGIQREQSLQYASLQKMLVGEPVPKPVKKCRNANTKISILTARHTAGEITTTEFLRAFAYHTPVNIQCLFNSFNSIGSEMKYNAA